MIILLIPLFTVLVLWVVIGLHFDNLIDFITGSQDEVDQKNNDYYIGKEITVTWLLDAARDYRVSTHTLLTENHDLFGLKSRSVNLQLFQWRTTIRGVVEQYYGGMYIIEVDSAVEAIGVGSLYTGSDSSWSILPDVDESGDVIDIGLDDSELYFPDAGILFDVTGSWSYSAIKGDGQTINLQAIDGVWETVFVNYFRCKASNPNQDCASLTKKFSKSAEFTVTSANGDVYYKLSEIDSWFVANGSLYGYFINGATSDRIQELTKYIVLPNKKYISDKVMPFAPQLCSSIDHTMSMVDTFDVKTENNAIIVSIMWSDAKWNALKCVLSVDLKANLWASLVSLEVDGSAVDLKENEAEASTWKNIVDYDVEQFPINKEKTYIFSSSRGHTIIFPSRNISFSPGEAGLNVDVEGVNCYAYMNVGLFADQDSLETNAKMRVYECSIKKGITNFGRYRYLQSEDEKNFLLEVVDDSWKEFVDNIEIK